MMLEILFIPILLVLMLSLIHTYFGMGILKRGIIFTDLAIAQFAALGSAVSLGYFGGAYMYEFTLLSALLSAFLIAYASQTDIRLEAFIGILYVLGASGIMIVLADSAEGMEHFKSLLASDILFTTSDALLHSFFIYLGIAFLLWKLYPRLQGFYKELLFFSLLALTVTSSVSLAGVFVVFVLLIAPALVALTLGKGIYFAVGFSWLFTVSSIFLSYYLDLPTGYALVFVGALLSAIIVLTSAKRV